MPVSSAASSTSWRDERKVLAWTPTDSPRIVVFRARPLGDMPCAAPAMHALHTAWPRTRLTLVGLPWVRQWAISQPFIDEFVEFPGMIGLPEREPDAQAFRQFLAEMRQRRYDLAVQLHGSGRLVNRLVAAFGALHVAGFADPGCFNPEPALHTPWPAAGPEAERLLALTDHLGLTVGHTEGNTEACRLPTLPMNPAVILSQPRWS